MDKPEHSKTQDQIDGLGFALGAGKHHDDDVEGHVIHRVVVDADAPSWVPGQEPGPKVVS